jgi:hypothetical protein
MNDELVRIWKESLVAYLKPYKHLFGVTTEKNHKKPQSGLPASWPRRNTEIGSRLLTSNATYRNVTGQSTIILEI